MPTPYYRFDYMTPKEGIRTMLSALDALNTVNTSETLEALLNEIEDDLERAEKLAAKEVDNDKD